MQWQLQEAKQHFSQLVRKAEKEGPQMVSRHGFEAVWILSAEDYHHLVEKKKGSLVDFFQSSPHRDMKLKFPRKKDLPRKINL